MIDLFEGDLRPMEYWHLTSQREVDKWSRGIEDGYSTGFRSLDRYSRLVEGQLTIIAARPSMGKTALAMQMAQSVAQELRKSDEGCVAVFSAEMRGVDLFVRYASALAGVSMHDLRQGQARPDEMRRVQEASNAIRDLPLWIDDNSGPTTQQMLAQLSSLNESIPVRMMMFDFMELGGDRSQIETMRLSQICHNLKGIAKTLNIPVVALSQLNRDVENRANKMPALSDLRFSGMIEQLADVVVFVMRPEYYVERMQPIDVPDEDKRGIAYVQYAKNRNGPVGLTKLAFVKERILFADLQRDEVLPGVRR